MTAITTPTQIPYTQICQIASSTMAVIMYVILTHVIFLTLGYHAK